MDNGNEIWVSVGVTRNLGNYQSLKLDAGAKITLAPGQDRDSAFVDLWAEVESQIEDQLDRSGLGK